MRHGHSAAGEITDCIAKEDAEMVCRTLVISIEQ
jgi:hypothetical protein